MNVKNLVLGIGIVIVYALVLWQGVEAFYPSPQFDDYCSEVIPKPILDEGSRVPIKIEDDFKECREEFNSARDSHSSVVFVIALIVGILTLVLGYFVLSVEPVGSALIGSGIWAIFWGSVINWRNFSNIWRFLLLLFALVLLIWLTLRLNRPEKKRKK